MQKIVSCRDNLFIHLNAVIKLIDVKNGNNYFNYRKI